MTCTTFYTTQRMGLHSFGREIWSGPFELIRYYQLAQTKHTICRVGAGGEKLCEASIPKLLDHGRCATSRPPSSKFFSIRYDQALASRCRNRKRSDLWIVGDSYVGQLFCHTKLRTNIIAIGVRSNEHQSVASSFCPSS